MRIAAGRTLGMIRNMSSLLKELLLEILVLGLVIQGLGAIFVSDQAGFALGLWLGIICSWGMAINMNWALETGMDMGEGARNHVIKYSVIRYAVVLIIFGVLAFLYKYTVVPFFVGLMTLKVAAYLQPFTHKLILKVQGKQDSH